MALPNNHINLVPLTVNLGVTTHHNKPCLVIRQNITDMELIKNIISCAYHKKQVIILPRFMDEIRAMAILIEKGIVYRENGQYYFTF